MLGFLVVALRYAFLFLLYLFLFTVLRLFTRELRPNVEQGKEMFLMVMTSSSGNTPRRGEIFPLKERLTLGRASDNDIVLFDSHVSAYHTLLYFQKGTFWIKDLGSTNGTYLNGNFIRAPCPLRAGDTLRLGETTFLLTSQVPFTRL